MGLLYYLNVDALWENEGKCLFDVFNYLCHFIQEKNTIISSCLHIFYFQMWHFLVRKKKYDWAANFFCDSKSIGMARHGFSPCCLSLELRCCLGRVEPLVPWPCVGVWVKLFSLENNRGGVLSAFVVLSRRWCRKSVVTKPVCNRLVFGSVSAY